MNIKNAIFWLVILALSGLEARAVQAQEGQLSMQQAVALAVENNSE